MNTTNENASDSRAALGTGKKKERVCCKNGESHRFWEQGNWVYAAEPLVNQGVGPYAIVRFKLEHLKEVPPRSKPSSTSYMCGRGHWMGDSSMAARIVSEREAANLVRRLNAGLPIHRDRWLGIGGFLLVAAAIAQAIGTFF